MRNHRDKSERIYLLSRLKEAEKAKDERRVAWHEEAQENLTPSQAFRYGLIMDLKEQFPDRFDFASQTCWSTYRIATLDSVSGRSKYLCSRPFIVRV